MAEASISTAPERAEAKRRLLPGAALWVASVLYAALYLRHGWIPHDEGALAQSAWRVAIGQLPHRDFDEIYTGGLSFINAAAFRVFGVRLLAPRIALLAVFSGWVAVVIWIAARTTRSRIALLAAGLAVAWSIPNYPAAMPSWYNLFFATFGTGALFRYRDALKARWLVTAGICCGMSFLIKITGICFAAAAFLFLVYVEQDGAADDASVNRPSQVAHVYAGLLTLTLLGFCACLVWLVRRTLGMSEVVQFVLPGCASAALLIWRAWQPARRSSAQRLRDIVSASAWFTAGAIAPVLGFLVPYIASRSLSDLWIGLFVLPSKRLTFAAVRPVSSAVLLASVPVAFALGYFGAKRACVRYARLVAAGLLGLTVLFSVVNRPMYGALWASMLTLGPLTVVAGLATCLRTTALDRRAREQLFVLLVAVALCGLVQFPYSAPVYFLYIAPLVALAALAVGSIRSEARSAASALVFGFYLIVALAKMHPDLVWHMRRSSIDPSEPTAVLALPRGGLEVKRSEAREYTQLVGAIRAHATGPYIFAAPDCPEVYFLSGFRNPTRTLYDFFDDSAGRTARVVATLVEEEVSVVVVNGERRFSGPVPPALMRELTARYPSSVQIGRFTVRWHE